MHSDPNYLLTSRPPEFSAAQAEEIGRKYFEIDAKAKPLWSERDQNHRLRTNSGEQFVLKIANAMESPEVIDFQTRALEHIALTDPGLPVPRTVANIEGRDYCQVGDDDGRDHMVRLITWLDGEVIEEAETGPDLLRKVGGKLARLGVALRDFSHPAANHHLIWDLKNAAELLDLLPHIDDPGLRALLEKSLIRFKQNVVPDLENFRSQIIHADLNRGNVLISSGAPQEVSGIIDFGDMVNTPLIMDLAIAAAYHLSESGDPLGNSLHFIAGYHEVTPLQRMEAEHLLDLMLARLCTSITVQMWRAKLYPENSEYLLIHNSFSQRTLQHIVSCPRDVIQSRILQCCGF